MASTFLSLQAQPQPHFHVQAWLPFKMAAMRLVYSWFPLIPKGIKGQRHGGHVGVPNNGR
jgi:hypothetical protein